LIRGSIVAGLLAALLLPGCGGESETERRKDEIEVQSAVREAHLKNLLRVKLAEQKRREEHPGQTLAPAKFSAALAERYEADREVCKARSPSEIANNLGIDEGSDPEAIAQAYAKSFPGKFRQPAYEGCLAGLE